MDDLNVRPMRARDVVKFSRFGVPRFIGYIAEREGEFKGAVCVAWGKGNRAFLCLELSEEIRRRPIFMNRWAKAMINAAHEAGTELYTIENAKEPTASRWLARLGFRPTDELQGTERIWKWQAFQQ